ncbi:MAG: PaaI family thioesterase [Dehalococcoidia bacterium]|nr:PaaI family thioesterase [Dehalococcoidia bacterium]
MPARPPTEPTPPLGLELYEQYCFACGRQNPLGLQLRFDRDAEGVVARYEPRREDQGFPGVMHGGVATALLDESMAWAMYAAGLALGLTAKMEMRFRRPVPLDAPLTVRARLSHVRGRRIEAAATLDSEDGARLVEASALFLRLPREEEAKLLAAIGWG